MSSFVPQLPRRPIGDTGIEVRLGHALLDDYLRFVAARCRPNSVLAAGYDLKVFFTQVPREPVQVTMTNIFDFIAAQRFPPTAATSCGSMIIRERSDAPARLRPSSAPYQQPDDWTAFPICTSAESD